MQNHKIIIGIGGNLKTDDGTHPIKVAMKAIRYFNDYSIKVTDQSSWYETEPIPKSNQPNFFNCIVFANTILNELDVSDQVLLEKNIVKILENENVAYDIGSYRSAPPGLRIWGGPTINPNDIKLLLPWLQWAFEDTFKLVKKGN